METENYCFVCKKRTNWRTKYNRKRRIKLLMCDECKHTINLDKWEKKKGKKRTDSKIDDYYLKSIKKQMDKLGIT